MGLAIELALTLESQHEPFSPQERGEPTRSRLADGKGEVFLESDDVAGVYHIFPIHIHLVNTPKGTEQHQALPGDIEPKNGFPREKRS